MRITIDFAICQTYRNIQGQLPNLEYTRLSSNPEMREVQLTFVAVDAFHIDAIGSISGGMKPSVTASPQAGFFSSNEVVMRAEPKSPIFVKKHQNSSSENHVCDKGTDLADWIRRKLLRVWLGHEN